MAKQLIGTKVSKELKELLEQEASKEHRSLSNFIKHALLTFLKEHKEIDFRED